MLNNIKLQSLLLKKHSIQRIQPFWKRWAGSTAKRLGEAIYNLTHVGGGVLVEDGKTARDQMKVNFTLIISQALGYLLMLRGSEVSQCIDCHCKNDGNCNNYQSITLFSIMGKFFTPVVLINIYSESQQALDVFSGAQRNS